MSYCLLRQSIKTLYLLYQRGVLGRWIDKNILELCSIKLIEHNHADIDYNENLVVLQRPSVHPGSKGTKFDPIITDRKRDNIIKTFKRVCHFKKEWIKYIVEKYDLNINMEDGYALVIASTRGEIDKLEFLISIGANIKHMSLHPVYVIDQKLFRFIPDSNTQYGKFLHKDEKPYMIYSASMGHFETVQWLLKKIGSCTRFDLMVILSLFILHKNKQHIQSFIEFIEKRVETYDPVILECCVLIGDMELLNYFLIEKDMKEERRHLLNLFHFSMKGGNVNMFKYIFNMLEARDKYLINHEHIRQSAERGHIDMVMYLTENISDKYCLLTIVLGEIIKRCELEMVRGILLLSGKYVRRHGIYISLIKDAVHTNNVDMLKVIYDMSEIKKFNWRMASLIINESVEKECLNVFMHVVDIATERNVNLPKFLRYCDYWYRIGYYIVEYKQLDILKILWSLKVKLYRVNELLYRAVEHDSLKMVKILIDMGARITWINSNPMYIAVKKANIDMVQLLVERVGGRIDLCYINKYTISDGIDRSVIHSYISNIKPGI